MIDDEPMTVEFLSTNVGAAGYQVRVQSITSKSDKQDLLREVDRLARLEAGRSTVTI